MGGLGEVTGAEQKAVGHADLLLGCVFTVILTGAPPPPLLCLTTSQAVGSDSVNQFKIHSGVFVHPHEWKLGWFHVFGDMSWLWDAWAARGLEPQRGERRFFAS